jgi:hypothetical protein
MYQKYVILRVILFLHESCYDGGIRGKDIRTLKSFVRPKMTIEPNILLQQQITPYD